MLYKSAKDLLKLFKNAKEETTGFEENGIILHCQCYKLRKAVWLMGIEENLLCSSQHGEIQHAQFNKQIQWNTSVLLHHDEPEGRAPLRRFVADMSSEALRDNAPRFR